MASHFQEGHLWRASADERHLPFEVKVPNATIRKAIAELEAGKSKRFIGVDALMADLSVDD